ncbi:MAG: DNA polymerase III subunit gamma/tau [Bacilli bacterium]|nr:DNA polymerase III subunit gamma/tau [Bacilli bacterium]
MAYKALYRTYRPQTFSEVIGQDHIVRTLQNSLANGKMSHAYLFTGPRGTGKTSVARIFAKALNCTTLMENEPCGKCVSCREISETNSPDVVEIDAASNNGVDEIRDIRDKVKFLPAGSKYKIYIIDEVHMLSQGAFNALLKTLEEPPKHVIFILATTEPHKVIPTIISRCQRFDFKALSVKEITHLIARVAEKENFKISEEAIVAISEGAEGGMRDALSYLDQAASFTDDEINIDDVNSVTGNLNYDKIIELARYFEEKNISQALKTISDLIIMGKEVNKVVSGLLQFYRDILLYKSIDTSMFTKYIYEKAEFKNLASKIDAKKIFYYVDVLSDVQIKIKTSSTPGIYLDIAVIKMINEIEGEDYQGRIKALEEKVANQIGGEFAYDEEKINLLESKVNKVISELSRLDLPGLVNQVKDLEKTSTKDQTTELTALKTEIETLKEAKESRESLIQAKDKQTINEKGDFDYLLFEKKLLNLEEKIDNLEKRLKVSRQKVSRKKVNDGQLSFFNNKDLSFDESEEKAVAEMAEEKTEAADNGFEAEEENSTPLENTKETAAIKEEQLDLGFIKLSDFVDDKEEKEAINPKPAKAVSLRTTNDEEIRESEKSQMVRRLGKTKAAIEERPIIPKKPSLEKETEEIPETKDEVDPISGIDDPEYNSYSVSVLERILHSSRTSEAREDKVRIINLWKTLTRNCKPENLNVAQLLQDGQIVAVGDKELIIVYSSAPLCNQVMKTKFKRQSLQLLYDVLGDSYNYMAIPDRIWIEKRTEYINQYNIGVRYPKITPLNDPGLSIANEYNEMSTQDKLVNEALYILGQDIVKIE